MKKNSIGRTQSSMVAQATPQVLMTIGLDLGDRSSRFCCLNEKGEIEKEGSVAMTKKAMLGKFGMLERHRIAMEVGTHSPWVSR